LPKYLVLSKLILSQTYARALQAQNVQKAIAKAETKLHLKGLIGSSLSFVLAETCKQ